MLPFLERLTCRLRALSHTDWDECTPARWMAQIAVGVIPGILIVGLLSWLSQSSSVSKTNRSASTVASIVPLFSAASMADSLAFHRQDVSEGVAARVEFRHPRGEQVSTGPKRVLSVTKRTSPLGVDFQSPRREWKHLSAAIRAQIDCGIRATVPGAWKRAVLHGSGYARGNLPLLRRYQSDIQGTSTGAPYHFVIGNGSDSANGSVEVSSLWTTPQMAQSADLGAGSIQICLIGDFSSAPPTQDQLEALDELCDYLRVKTGSIPITTHALLTGVKDACLGGRFPAEQLLRSFEGQE